METVDTVRGVRDTSGAGAPPAEIISLGGWLRVGATPKGKRTFGRRS